MSSKTYFSNLDGLRTIAFLFVFSEHILWSALKQLDTGDGLFHHMFYTLFCNGGFGVSVFFVISGFLITFLLLQEKELTNKIDVGAFYVRRILRIWPLYLVLVTVVFLALPFVYQLTNSGIENNANLWYYVFFISNFDVLHIADAGQQAFMQSSVTWSVSIEEQFYLIWPWLFFIVPKRLYIFIFFFFIVLGLFFRSYYAEHDVFIYFHTLGNCCDLAIGGLCAWLVFNVKAFVAYFQQLSAIRIYGIYVLGLIFVLTNEYYLDFTYSNVLNRLLNTLFFAFFILTQNYSSNMGFKLSKARFLTWSGKYTYGLYLLHPMAFFVVKAFVDYFDISYTGFYGTFAVAMVALVISYLMAIFSYHYLELFFLRLKNKWSKISQ